jgi:hypothetical protein
MKKARLMRHPSAGDMCWKTMVKLGRSIRWDPDKEQVIGDKDAQAMCSKTYPTPWDIALKSAVKV